MSTNPFPGHRIHFLDELDGPPVQELKQQLAGFLTCEHEIRRAFLIRINRDESPKPKLALCLVGERTNAVRLAATAGTIFSELFPGIDNMEVVFLNDTQLREVGQLAQPFYVSDGSDQCRPN